LSFLLDSTVLIDALRGRPAAERIRELRDVGQVPWTCAINIEEIVRGAFAREEDAIRRFLGALRLAPLGREEAERAGRWRRRYAGEGLTLSQSDCLIAAAAVSAGVPVATGNPKHFPMAEVEIRHWPVGE
jgi:predicted nucleic acid-binding protein